jgi:hypothetical protein
VCLFDCLCLLTPPPPLPYMRCTTAGRWDTAPFSGSSTVAGERMPRWGATSGGRTAAGWCCASVGGGGRVGGAGVDGGAGGGDEPHATSADGAVSGRGGGARAARMAPPRARLTSVPCRTANAGSARCELGRTGQRAVRSAAAVMVVAAGRAQTPRKENKRERLIAPALGLLAGSRALEELEEGDGEVWRRGRGGRWVEGHSCCCCLGNLLLGWVGLPQR